VHYQNHPEWDEYCGAAESGVLPLHRALATTRHQRLVREMILQLKRGYLDIEYFRNKFGVNIVDRWREVWTANALDELATIDYDRGRIDLTRQGLLSVDAMLPAFFEPQFQGVRYT
jgi:oxygen-independent coproporphyrinogen-3 oxidase